MSRTILIAVAAALLIGDPVDFCEAAAADDVFHANWSHAGMSITIEIRSGPFNAQHHKIVQRNGCKFVDGQRAIGIDCSGEIETEISKFEIVWNGTRVKVPREAYAPLFNFRLTKAKYFPGGGGELMAVKADQQNAILFAFAGGGGVNEWVWLSIERDGKWLRFVGSDGESPL